MNEVPAMIGTCINCLAPGSLLATLGLILTGVGVVVHVEMRKAKIIREGWRLVRVSIKFMFIAIAPLVLLTASPANAGPNEASKVRLAQASSQACMSNCTTQAESCKRACPQTFSTPCLSACDSQAQTCTRACQTK
jgi:hypothetical protein